MRLLISSKIGTYLYMEKRFVESDYCTKYKPALQRQVAQGKPICGEWRKKEIYRQTMTNRAEK